MAGRNTIAFACSDASAPQNNWSLWDVDVCFPVFASYILFPWKSSEGNFCGPCYAGYIYSTVRTRPISYIVSRHVFPRELSALYDFVVLTQQQHLVFDNKVLCCVVLYQHLVCSLHVGNEGSRPQHTSRSYRLVLPLLNSFTPISYTQLSSHDGLHLRRCTLANRGIRAKVTTG